jgi:hypothetical protein
LGTALRGADLNNLAGVCDEVFPLLVSVLLASAKALAEPAKPTVVPVHGAFSDTSPAIA